MHILSAWTQPWDTLCVFCFGKSIEHCWAVKSHWVFKDWPECIFHSSSFWRLFCKIGSFEQSTFIDAACFTLHREMEALFGEFAPQCARSKLQNNKRYDLQFNHILLHYYFHWKSINQHGVLTCDTVHGAYRTKSACLSLSLIVFVS